MDFYNNVVIIIVSFFYNFGYRVLGLIKYFISRFWEVIGVIYYFAGVEVVFN